MAGQLLRIQGRPDAEPEQWEAPHRLKLKPPSAIRSEDQSAARRLRKALDQVADLVELPDEVERAWAEYQAVCGAVFALPAGVPDLPSLVREAKQVWSREQTARRRAAYGFVGDTLRAAGPSLYDALAERVDAAVSAHDDRLLFQCLKAAGVVRNWVGDVTVGISSPPAPLSPGSELWLVGRPDVWFADGAPDLSAANLDEHRDDWDVGLKSAEEVLANAVEAAHRQWDTTHP